MKTSDGKRPIIKNKRYAPATGIQSDFEKVLTTFVNTKSVRYEEFATIWRDKKLSLIWAGRQSDREVVEFMEECMKIAFKMFLPPYGFQARVGALYLMYGLYFTQPCLPKVKIRVTLTDWGQIKSMQEEFTKQNHHDTHFILLKMLSDGAFFFCATTEEPKSNRYSQDDPGSITAENLREDRQSIDDLFAEESLEQLHMIHTQYYQLKAHLSGPDASRPERSLDVLQDRFPSSITEQIQNHHERWNTKESRRQGKRSRALPTIDELEDKEENHPDLDSESGDDVGQRRARLKAIAFQGTKNKQRYKHRTLVTELSSSPDKSPKKKRGRPASNERRHQSIQKAPKEETTLHSTETSTPMVVEPSSPSGLLHMPQLSEPEAKPGIGKVRKIAKRKITSQTEDPSSPKLSAQKKPKKVAKVSPRKEVKKKRRGRPAGSGKGPIGRPKVVVHNLETSDKMVKSRVIPLKIKDTGKRKYVKKCKLGD